MLPYAVIPYYGPITNYPTVNDTFDDTGAGTGYWARVFMCNGQNNTPDLRGRVLVGATNTPSTNLPIPIETRPGYQGNPVYDYGLTPGANTVRLELPQIPAHNHVGSTASTSIPPHSHTLSQIRRQTGNNTNHPQSFFDAGWDTPSSISTDAATLTATTSLTIANAGQNEFHPNVQPGLALYYIQYRPT